MEKTLSLPIVCGKTTCASEPGKFCPWLRTARFGTLAFCQIFEEREANSKYPTPLEIKDGWIQRHQKCLEFEGREHQSYQTR